MGARKAMYHRLNTEEFIRRAILKHGEQYSYDKTIYTNADIKVSIACKQHGDFQQRAANHLAGKGCNRCGIENRKRPLRENYVIHFMEKANKIHNNFYTYTQVEFVNAVTKVKIICPVHGIFEQTPNIHLTGSGCQTCAMERSKTACKKDIQQFIEDAKKIHNNNYLYNKVVYGGSFSSVDIICPKHGVFSQLAANHLQGCGCPACSTQAASIKRTLTSDEFIEKANQVHNNYYSYDDVIYVNNSTNVKITCPIHENFEQNVGSHLRGSGCPKCGQNKKVSKSALTWLLFLEYSTNISIIKEYNIPSSTYAADGFHRESNTIFEFYGDYFHGNPNAKYKLKSSDGFNVELAYEKTINREKELRELGYNLNVIWETDYKHLLSSIPEHIKQKALELWQQLNSRYYIVNGMENG